MNEITESSESISDNALCWFQTTFLFAECYTYRRILESFQFSNVFKNVDPFISSKINGWIAAEQLIDSLMTTYLNRCIERPSESNNGLLKELLLLCTWGNQFDLSLSAAKPVVGHDPLEERNPDHSNRALMQFPGSEYLLDDQSEPLVQFIIKRKFYCLELIADNAGVELLSDLLLIHYLLKHSLISSVRIHLKRFPWFVSDATKNDLQWLLDRIAQNEAGKRLSEDLQELQSPQKCKLIVTEEPKWTNPKPFWILRQQGDLNELVDKPHTLIIMKGDLNYRKLTGDEYFDLSKNLSTFEQYKNRVFGCTPSCILRTLKSDTCSSLSDQAIQRAERLTTGTGQSWLTCGKFAVIQFAQ